MTTRRETSRHHILLRRDHATIYKIPAKKRKLYLFKLLHCFVRNVERTPLSNTAVAAKSLQSCPTLCDPLDSSPPGSTIPGILQARTLERSAISFSNAWKWKVKVKWLSRVRLFATPWTAAHRLLCPWDFPGKSTGVGCHCLLQDHMLGHKISFSKFKKFYSILNIFSNTMLWD